MRSMEHELAMLLADTTGTVERTLLDYNYNAYWRAADTAFTRVSWAAHESMCAAYDARYNEVFAADFAASVPADELRAVIETCWARLALGGG